MHESMTGFSYIGRNEFRFLLVDGESEKRHFMNRFDDLPLYIAVFPGLTE